MTPSELRRGLRQRRRELRKAMKHLRRQARERAQEVPALRRERRRRMVRRLALMAVLLLLASLLRCDCGPESEPPPSGPDAEVQAKPKLATPPAPLKRHPPRVQVAATPRGTFAGASRAPPAWLDELRLQVAARSPRLSACFAGSQGPGALRWAASVDPAKGTVSDHQLELVGLGDDLPREQRDCLVRALSAPPYKLSAAQAEAIPDRVGMVIEF
ncbi:MAG: hypothetical protein HY901_06380 [Deltaproteobacteria bacterium]|nr:hypothetical protein [Deltaproteobacteria bacterium]